MIESTRQLSSVGIRSEFLDDSTALMSILSLHSMNQQISSMKTVTPVSSDTTNSDILHYDENINPENTDIPSMYIF